MSKLLRKVWTIQYQMWTHRNSFVHQGTTSNHIIEEEAVKKAVGEEFIIGRNGLTADYGSFFQGTREEWMEAKGEVKRQWLANIWAARDRLRHEQGLEPWYKDPVAFAFIRRFNKRKKRKRGKISTI